MDLDFEASASPSHSLDFQHLRVGCSNPCGLRGKELSALSLGPGIWTFSETHLTAVTQRSTASTLAAYGTQQNRSIRSLFGAPVSYRHNSDTAGTWSGVGIIADFPSQELAIPWTLGERDAGRVMVSRHFVGPTDFTIASVHGFPAGPTWPKHRELTDKMLTTITQQVVIGATGCRIIQGDFNNPSGLDAFHIWRHYGWVEVQMMAQSQWGHTPTPTCKQATMVDLMWLSPEAANLCTQVGTMSIFADHLTVFADFQLPSATMSISRWPLPSPIEWDQINLTSWHDAIMQHPGPTYDHQSPDDFLANWAAHWEQQLHGHVQNQPDGQLPPRCQGRAKHTRPTRSLLAATVPKPSRPGEVALKSDLVSMAVHKWFRQLRRLQSYKHAALANKDTVDAEVYRLQLWHSIKRAKGFNHSFPAWWLQRRHKSPAAPMTLPMAPPSADLALIIFQDFKLNFERFELWHLRQKGKLLQAKHDRTCHALFHELRDPGRGQLDFLWDTITFAVLDFDQQTNQIHLDGNIPDAANRLWYHNGQQLNPIAANDDLLHLPALPANLEVGDEIKMTISFTSLEAIHEAMLNLWRPRWQKTSNIGSADWTRILNFVQAYMPSLPFPSATMDVSTWQHTLTKFPKRAARGVDGISVADLKHLPALTTQRLLDFLRQIDGQTCSWPSQFLFGKVISLAKRDHPHLPAHFRPVVILSCIYRAWSRLQAHSVIQRLAVVVPDAAQGFLPGRECANVWLRLQSYIELCLQHQLDFSGFSADLEKCFNNIDRDVLFALAQHVGLPNSLLRPWRNFLDSFERAFEVRTSLSPAVTSSQGLPEGCSLSVVGMILIDWAYHMYMKVLTPSVHLFSYVDNLTVAGFQTLDVVSAFFSTISFFDLWGLKVDLDKTYVWGLTPRSRELLRHLGLVLKQDAMELGGNMCFGKARRNRLFKARAQTLTAKWMRLKRSKAPQASKIQVLPLSFWASALHGAANTLIAEGHLHDLRQSANRALHLNQAGTNALLRFSLQTTMLADPGFFYVTLVVNTFRRLCLRSTSLFACWRWWFDAFQGDLQPGPFSTLLQTLNSIGWFIVTPPHVCDHNGDQHDLLLLNNSLLQRLLQDAWLWKVARQMHQRPTMRDLDGIDRYNTVERNKHLTAHQASLQSALQSGAFIDSWIHSKYDSTKSGLCTICNCPNTHSHLLVCRKYQHLRDKFSLTSAEMTSWPQSFALHLLCPSPPFTAALRSYFQHLPDLTAEFASGPSEEEMDHLFTDGSCFAQGRWETHTASWAVFNASSQCPVASGPVQGLEQTIGRGEMVALISALQWALRFRKRVHIWMDAKFVHDGFQLRRQGIRRDVGGVNADLWLLVEALLDDGVDALADSSWIPSHLDLSKCESPFEEWIANNNQKVDQMAVRCNSERPMALQTLVHQQHQWDAMWHDRLCRLRQYYFGVYEASHGTATEPNVEIIQSSDDEEEIGGLYSFSDILSSLPEFCTFEAQTGFPISFLHALIAWIYSHDEVSEVPVAVSFLEITVALVRVDPILFPHRDPVSGRWQIQEQSTLFERPTLAHYLGIVQKTFLYLANLCGEFDPILRSITCARLGVHTPQKGILLRLTPDLRNAIGHCLACFTSRRPIRKSADLARPLG